jgi:hypothetical protein
MKSRFATVVLLIAGGWSSCPIARAAVVVLANRTDHAVHFKVSTSPDQARECKLGKRDVLPIPWTGRVEVSFSSGDKPRRYHLANNAVYYFIGTADSLELRQISFARRWFRSGQPAAEEDPEPTDSPTSKPARLLLKLPVKLLVDQEERTVQKVWEKKLRRRVEEASEILERHCRVRLEVEGVGEWKSSVETKPLMEMLRDFEGQVTVQPGHLAVGFTGRRNAPEGDRALGCTRGPFGAHILIREWKPTSEPERLEVLMHEVGHVLGACHSPEVDSVMRPNLADGWARRLAFRVGYDPVNTLVMNLVAEELARRPVRSLRQLSLPTRTRLLDIFSTMTRVLPEDPAAPKYVRFLGGTPPEPLRMRPLPTGAAEGARAVVAAVVSAAKQNGELPAREAVASGERSRLTGDALTAHYFQTAAAAARRLPAECSASAYLLGLAIALDRTALLRGLGLPGIPWEAIERDEEGAARLRVLGEPTMHGRHDMPQLFVTAAALVVLVEGQDVTPAGLMGELLQAQGADAFRFDDLAAILAGIAFGTQIDGSPHMLVDLATSFRVADYTLAPEKESVGLSREEFAREYGSTSDERFLGKQDDLRKRLLALPGYQPLTDGRKGR